MMMLRQILQKASDEGWAVGHFNISNLEQLEAVVEAARQLRSPVMIGTSEGERNFIGLHNAVALVRSAREKYCMPFFLNADHTKSVEAAKMVVDAGYDSIHIDLSALPFEENIRGTREVVVYARAKNPEISVEGELGILRGESKLQKEIIEIKSEDLTTPDKAKQFVEKTGVNRFAPAVGNIHGIPANTKFIDIELIKKIREILPKDVAMVLHGGSAISDDQIKAAIKAGINNIHINTEIRVAYVDALKKAIADMPDETTPYKLFPPVIEAVRAKTEEKLILFGSVNVVEQLIC